MRLASVLVLAAVITSPALAQTQYADSSGGFVVLHGLSFGPESYSQRSIDAGIGYRFASGVDASVRVVGRSRFESGIAVGPTVGFTRPLGGGFDARIEGSVLASQASGTSLIIVGEGSPERLATYQARSLRTDVTATITRPVRLVGSLRLHPTLGLFVRTGTERVTVDGAPAERRSDPFPESRAGVHVALPLSFQLFGQTASVEAAMRFSPYRGFSFEVPGDRTFSPDGGAYAGGGLRLNF